MRERKLDGNSRLRDVLNNPLGHDVLTRLCLQLGKNPNWLKNPLLGLLRLKTLLTLADGNAGRDFVPTMLQILNAETERLPRLQGAIEASWWKEAVFYQIYPRSFRDSNGDGIGDLRGILASLDALQELGVNALWLSPIYMSPNDDNGYDISDYQAIHPDFGSMEDFDHLLRALHERGMRLIMDLVVNHSSDEHPWFQEALTKPDSPKRRYYFLREGGPETPPNNWGSIFSGSAWRYFPEQGLWGLHLFSAKQMDLNWQEEALRRDIAEMVRWWLEKGVDGFRLDVINYISKTEGLPDSHPFIQKIMGLPGIEHYFSGPRLHEYLRELRREAFQPYQAFSVGECPGAGQEMGRLLSSARRGELDLIFSFDHLETPGHARLEDYRYDLNYYKEYMRSAQMALDKDDWMSLFFENHDNTRRVSKINPDPAQRPVLAKLLAVLMLGMKGTPFIYQGQELGLLNENFQSMDEIRDVESLNFYRDALARGEAAAAEAWEKIRVGTRDHARTPYPWNGDPEAGFSSATPWLRGGAGNQALDLEGQMADEHSVWNFYRRLIALRREHPALIYGEVAFIEPKRKDYWGVYRNDGLSTYYVEANLGDGEIARPLPVAGMECLFSNLDKTGASPCLRPYEANIYRVSL